MLNGSETIALEWSFAGLALIFVLVRLYVKIYNPESKHDLGDYIVVLAWLNFAACCACDTVLHQLGAVESWVSYTGDLSKINPDPKKNIKILKIIYASFFPYIIDLWLIKAGILSFYYTIIPRTLPLYRLCLYIITGYCVGSFLAVFFGNMFWCHPTRRNWSLSSEELCVSSAKFPPFFGTVASTITTDVLILCLPFPLLRGIPLPRRRMIGVIFIFTLGFLTIFAAVFRVIVISISARITTVTVWTAMECSTGIMVACVPALRVLILRREGSSQPSRDRSTRLYPRPGPPVLSIGDRNEIWDGTDATAPQWMRMASLPSGGNAMVSPKSALFDESVDEALSMQLTLSKNSHEHGSSISNFDMVTAIPNIRLQIGRGIVENAPMGSPVSSHRPTSDHLTVNSTSPHSSVLTMRASGSNFVRLSESDDTMPYVLNRWDTGESGRLELGRIVDTVAGVNRPRSISVSNDRKGRLGTSDLNPDLEHGFSE